MRSVILLPPAPGNVAISAKLIAHLSRHYPTQEHHPFHLEHRLFSDTSSQLPGSDVKQRCYTHILNLSHHPHHAFVSSTKAGNADESSTVTIPASSAESFAGLISTKLQPAWYPRQMLSLEKGVCVSIDEKSLIVCVGDARASARSQGAGALRGTVVEIFRIEDIASDATIKYQDKCIAFPILPSQTWPPDSTSCQPEAFGKASGGRRTASMQFRAYSFLAPYRGDYERPIQA
jgi:hypothetical protein